MRAEIRLQRWRMSARVSYVLAALFFSTANADIVLTSQNLNAALKQIQRLELRLQRIPGDTTKADTIFQLGEKAYSLTQLLDKEFAAHGNMQQGLLALAVKRASELGISIEWSADHQHYFYDGAAYREYLKLAPDGQHAALSTYRILYQAFFRSNPDDKEALMGAVKQKRAFLNSFRNFEKAAQIEMFLGIDYRDIWRLCRKVGDQECADQFGKLVQQQFVRVFTKYPDTDEAKIARRLQQRFDSESSETNDSTGL